MSKLDQILSVPVVGALLLFILKFNGSSNLAEGSEEEDEDEFRETTAEVKQSWSSKYSTEFSGIQPKKAVRY